MTTPLDGRQLADELDAPQAYDKVDLIKVASALRSLADKLDMALKVANDLSESMDSVHTDRVTLAEKVRVLTAERNALLTPAEVS